MSQSEQNVTLPAIPAKRYFTIGEVSELCGVKPHVLRYWEQEFTQLRPVKRRGNRRYYPQLEVLLISLTRQLLYHEAFTINGARNRLGDTSALEHNPEAAVRLSGHELQRLRKDLSTIEADLTQVLEQVDIDS